jgi:hypothetical protein
MWQPFAAPLDFAMRAPNAALWGLGAAAGEAYKRASGDEAGGNRLTRDLIQGGQALLLKSAAAYPQVAAGRVASPKQVIGREEVAVPPAMAGGLGPIKESGPVRTPPRCRWMKRHACGVRPKWGSMSTLRFITVAPLIFANSIPEGSAKRLALHRLDSEFGLPLSLS